MRHPEEGRRPDVGTDARSESKARLQALPSKKEETEIDRREDKPRSAKQGELTDCKEVKRA